MQEIQVNKEMWTEWVRNPVTNLVFKTIRERREQIKENLAVGYYGDNYQEAVGVCRGLKDILDVSYDDMGEG